MSPPAAVPAATPGWVRALLGWTSVLVGLVLLPTPLPLGALFLAFGVACLGPRNRFVRLGAATLLKKFRRWAHRGSPVAAGLLRATLGLRHAIQRIRSRWRPRS